jgi:hypothetical protein
MPRRLLQRLTAQEPSRSRDDGVVNSKDAKAIHNEWKAMMVRSPRSSARSWARAR